VQHKKDNYTTANPRAIDYSSWIITILYTRYCTLHDISSDEDMSRCCNKWMQHFDAFAGSQTLCRALPRNPTGGPLFPGP